MKRRARLRPRGTPLEDSRPEEGRVVRVLDGDGTSGAAEEDTTGLACRLGGTAKDDSADDRRNARELDGNRNGDSADDRRNVRGLDGNGNGDSADDRRNARELDGKGRGDSADDRRNARELDGKGNGDGQWLGGFESGIAIDRAIAAGVAREPADHRRALRALRTTRARRLAIALGALGMTRTAGPEAGPE